MMWKLRNKYTSVFFVLACLFIVTWYCTYTNSIIHSFVGVQSDGYEMGPLSEGEREAVTCEHNQFSEMFFSSLECICMYVNLLHVTFYSFCIHFSELSSIWMTYSQWEKGNKNKKNGKDEDDHKKQWNIVDKIHKRHSKRNARCLPRIYLLRRNELFVLCGKETTNCRICVT